MKATLEISMYPLNSQYEKEIIEFIHRLRAYPSMKVSTGGMSTVVVGDYDELFGVVQREMKSTLENSKAVFVMKLAAGERTNDSIPEELR